MNNQVTISVVGCGWLGLPLAESLIIKGYYVKGSTTTPQKLEILRNKGIEPYLVHFGDNTPLQLDQLMNCDVLIINIPPGRRSAEGPANYRRMADVMYKTLTPSRVKKVILLSSTSVYSDTNTIVSETSTPEPDSEAGKLLLEVENQFLAIRNKQICVLRPAGLVGPGRHPGRFFKDKTRIPNGLAPVNLIHRDDVIGIIQTMIENPGASGVYNACSPVHPTKQEFYTQAAATLDMQAPDFIPEKKSYKIISSGRVYEELGYAYKYNNLIDWLKDNQDPDIQN